MRRAFHLRRAGLWLAASLVATTAVAQQPTAPPDAMLADAQLADVAFVDRAHGWAVGDRGVIWHTTDGMDAISMPLARRFASRSR